jgi:hypothetical protein
VVAELGGHDRALLNCPATSAGSTLCLEDTALYIAIKGDFASVVVEMHRLGSDLSALSKVRLVFLCMNFMWPLHEFVDCLVSCSINQSLDSKDGN